MALEAFLGFGAAEPVGRARTEALEKDVDVHRVRRGIDFEPSISWFG
jgi:hypothetical protein